MREVTFKGRRIVGSRYLPSWTRPVAYYGYNFTITKTRTSFRSYNNEHGDIVAPSRDIARI